MTRLGWIISTITLVMVLVLFVIGLKAAQAWDDTSPFYGWADKQMVMPAAVPSICPNMAPNGQCSCCNGAEIVKTKFRPLANSDDGWEWKNVITHKWEQIPNSIIHFGEPTPDGQPVMFVYPVGSDIMRCFFPGNGGGG